MRTAALVGVLVMGATGEARAFAGTPTAADLALFKCQRAITKETTKATATAAKVYRKVLDASVKDYHTRDDVTAKTEDLIVASLRKVIDSRALGSSIQEKTEARIVSACDPETKAFTVEDLLGLPGATANAPLNAKSLEPVSLTTTGAPASIDSVHDLALFAAKTAINEAIRPVLSSSPNAPTILDATVSKLLVKQPPPDDLTKVDDALESLLLMKQTIDGDDDGVIDPKPTTTSTTSTSTSTSTTSTTAPAGVCGNCIWEAGEQCDPCSPQAGPGCQADCTCDMFNVCNFF